jgi:PAS domain S-box-containing protein
MMRRVMTVPVLVLILGVAAIVAIALLQQRAVDSHEAELKLARVQTALVKLQLAPFRSSTRTGGSPAAARKLMREGKAQVDGTMTELERVSPPPPLAHVPVLLRADYAALDEIYSIGASGKDFGKRADHLAGVSAGTAAAIGDLLDRAGHEYDRRATQARVQGSVGSATVILLLLCAFGILYQRSARARASVESSEERFRTLVANIPGAVYRRAADDEWSMRFVSDTIAEITGYRAYEFVSGERAYASIVDPDQRDWAALEMTTSPENGAFDVEYPIIHADGSVRWVHDMGQPIRDAAGTILWIDGTISDVTEVKRLEQERERIELELRVAQRLEAVGHLAAGIAHEINTPVQFVSDSLAFLKGSFQALRRLIGAQSALCAEALDGRDNAGELRARLHEAEEDADLDYLDARMPAALERTVDGLGRVSTIVKAMRGFGRPQQVEHSSADLNDAMRSTLVVAQSEYKYVADLTTEFGDLPSLLCNVGEINQVFLNLVVNAAHAIASVAPADGDAKGVIQIRTAREGDTAVITISDTGPGIAPEIRERIFDPFFTTKPVGSGTGQGLAISRAIIVDKHGGTLTVDSEPGRGATFTVRLPMTVAATPVTV